MTRRGRADCLSLGRVEKVQGEGGARAKIGDSDCEKHEDEYMESKGRRMKRRGVEEQQEVQEGAYALDIPRAEVQTMGEKRIGRRDDRSEAEKDTCAKNRQLRRIMRNP